MADCQFFKTVAVWPLVLGLFIGCGSDDDPTPNANTTGNTKSGKSSTDRAKSEADFFPLVLVEDFEHFSEGEPTDEPTWSEDTGILKCSGEPRGYLYTSEGHRNFVLRFDYRFEPADNPDDVAKLNTGVLVYISDEDKIWPVSLEVQGKHVEMGQIKSNGGVAAVDIADDDAARQNARKAPGEWNSVEVVSHEGALTAFVNGTKICESKPGELSEGRIGFQSERAKVEFRNIRIKDEEDEEDEEE